MKDGEPFMITGSPGGDDQIMRTMQTLLNVIDFGMNVQEAIEAPRWSTTAFPASSGQFTMRPGTLSVESRVPPTVLEALKAKGHRLTVAGPWTHGSNAAISIDSRLACSRREQIPASMPTRGRGKAEGKRQRHKQTAKGRR